MTTPDNGDVQSAVRFNLTNCSYHDRAFVRKLGACWDAVNKTWFITKDVHDSHGDYFERWMPVPVTDVAEQQAVPVPWKAPKPLFSVVVNVTHASANQYDTTGACLKTGDSAEEQFQAMARQKGWTCMAATSKDNIYNHIDFHMSNAALKVTCDVKAEKKVKRRDTSITPNFTWLELHGVRRTDPGWLMSPSASTWICFQQGSGFLIFDRAKLAAHVREHWWDPSKPAGMQAKLYEPYARRAASSLPGYDIIMLVRMSDLVEQTDALIDVWE